MSLRTRDRCAPVDRAHVLIFWRNNLKILSYCFFGSVEVVVVTLAAALAARFFILETASAHGFAGGRFFPATLSTDDPFVNDELSLPTVSSIVTPDERGTRDTEISADIAKRITPNFAVEIGQSLINLRPPGERSVTGFGNLELGAKYEFFENDEHEAILSVGAGVEVGGTGSRDVEADPFSTLGSWPFFWQRLWRSAG